MPLCQQMVLLLEEFLVPIIDVDLFDTDAIEIPIVTRIEHVRNSSGTKKKKK
jgi:hypothetical protein